LKKRIGSKEGGKGKDRRSPQRGHWESGHGKSRGGQVGLWEITRKHLKKGHPEDINQRLEAKNKKRGSRRLEEGEGGEYQNSGGGSSNGGGNPPP